MIISQIAAMAKNRVIGSDNDLPWSIPRDMKFFREKTKGRILIMGRKTFESLPKPLPGRFHIIVTRNADYRVESDLCHVVQSLEESVEFAKTLPVETWGEEIFVCGGGEIYRQALPMSDRIYLTEIEEDFAGDTTYPELDQQQWTKTFSEKHVENVTFSFNTYERP